MLLTIDQAVDEVLSAARPAGTEDVDLLTCLGRTLAVDVASPQDVPPFDNSAMDGFALRAADQHGSQPRLRVVAELPAGRAIETPLPPGAAVKIMTGAPVPPGADAVVQVEATRTDGDYVVLNAPVPLGSNIRRAGEDVRRGDVVVAKGEVITAAHLGVLASAGMSRVTVARRPRVAILATGSELVPVESPLGPGQIRNSNSYTAYGQTIEAGAEPVLLGVARDDLDETKSLVSRALEEDVVVTSGGVSVGDYDFVKDGQEQLGVQRRFWGVRTKPGKPLAFGVRGATAVFGVPGNPVAAMVAFEVYVRPFVLTMLGRTQIWRPCVTAVAEEPVRRTRNRPELRRCRLRHDGERWLFTTTGPQGSGILSSMALADGLAFVPSEYPGAAAGERLPVMLLSGASDQRPPFPV
jgi:molybdopterin molybdotransferase